MPPAPYVAVGEILAKNGLEATVRSFLGDPTGASLRSVIFNKYPSLPIAEKNYLVGLAGQFMRAGTAQQGAVGGGAINQGLIPVNPGLGGIGQATDRFRYTTYVNVQDASGGDAGSIAVDVYSPVELSTQNVTGAAESQLSAWAAKYTKLAKYLADHPTSTGTEIVGVQRAW